MVIGIGVDIVQISRIEAAVQRTKRLLTRVFTATELEYCQRTRDVYVHLAGRFAAKEAVMKALGVGWGEVGWREIEILHTSNGQPRVILSGSAQRLAAQKGVRMVLVSIAHTDENAVAYAVAVGGEAEP